MAELHNAGALSIVLTLINGVANLGNLKQLGATKPLLFHFLGERPCSGSFGVGRNRFVVFAFSFPDTRALDEEGERLCGVPCLVLKKTVHDRQIRLNADDFNACIGVAEGFGQTVSEFDFGPACPKAIATGQKHFTHS